MIGNTGEIKNDDIIIMKKWMNKYIEKSKNYVIINTKKYSLANMISKDYISIQNSTINNSTISNSTISNNSISNSTISNSTISNNTININTMKYISKPQFVIMMMFFCILMMIPTTTIHAASNLKIKDNHSSFYYKGTRVKATYNNIAINLKNTPGLIYNDTALLSYKDAFVNSSIGATSTFSSSKGVITIKKDSTTIKMTIGSKIAYVNGQKRTLDTQPQKVTFINQKTTKILVPARFVAENLGYKYTWNSQTKSAAIVGPLNLYYDKKNQTYSKTQGKVTLNGTNINVTGMPGVIIDNTTLVSAKKVFANSKIGATYKYNSSKKVLTITKNSKSIVFTMGSNIATVNGKKQKMSTQARVIKNIDNANSYVMVPCEFVAKNLGYDYQWNKLTGTAVITSKKSNSPVLEPELGDDAIIGEDNNNTYLDLDINNASIEEYEHLNTIVNQDYIPNEQNEITLIESITKDESLSSSNETYIIKASTPFNNISSNDEEAGVITFNLGNSNSVDNSYVFDDSMVTMITSSYDEDTLNTDIRFDLATYSKRYEANLSEDKLTLTVTIYNNYITKIIADSNSSTDNITVTSMFALEYEISEDDKHIFIDMPFTKSFIGDFSTKISGNNLTSISSEDITSNSTRITIGKKAGSEYFISESDNKFMVSIISTSSNDFDIKIMKPDGVDISSITTQDLYLDEKFTITIPGNYVSYYSKNPIINLNSSIKSTNISLTKEGNTLITVSCSAILGFKLQDNETNITVSVGTPKEMYKNIVLLDPGHGGSDSGATRNGHYEKTLNFKILYTYLEGYFNNSNSETKVYYTRENDTFVNIYDRAAIANKVDADLFISLHMNSAGATSANGIEVFYSDSNNERANSGLNSKVMATIFANELSDTLNANNRGAKSSKFIVVHKNTVPAILIELGFMSNNSDLSNLLNTAYQKKAAKAIYDITASIFETYPTGR